MAIPLSFLLFTLSGLCLAAMGCATAKKTTPAADQESQTTVGAEVEVSSLEQLANFYADRGQQSKDQSTAASGEIPAPPAGKEWHVGKILVINQASRFALVDARVGRRPPKGAILVTKGLEGEVVCQMATSPETGREFVAADLVQGLPTVGDAVYWIPGVKNPAEKKIRNGAN